MTKITSTGTNPPLGHRKGFEGKYLKKLEEIAKELDNRIQEDVHRAIASDDEGMEKLFNSYIRNVLAWKKKEKFDEALMKSIENKLEVTDASKTKYRNWVIKQINIGTAESKPFTFKTDQRLRQAIEEVLVEQHRDLALPTFKTELASRKEQEKIDEIKRRLTEPFGYCSHCVQIDLKPWREITYDEHVHYLRAYSPGEPELLSLLPSEKPWGFVLKGNNRKLCYDLRKNEVEIVALPDTVYNRDYISRVYKTVNDTGKDPIDFIKNVVLKEVDDKVLSSDSKKAIRDALPDLEKLLEKAG